MWIQPLSQKHRGQAGAGSSCQRVCTAWVLFAVRWPWAKSLNHSVPPFSDFCDDYRLVKLRYPGPRYGVGLINGLVMCFEIHWSDLSACTVKALVPVLIYVQTDYSRLLLLSPNRVISSLFAVLLLDLSVWPPFLTTLFLYCFCFLHCIKHRHFYCHLNSCWVSMTFQV